MKVFLTIVSSIFNFIKYLRISLKPLMHIILLIFLFKLQKMYIQCTELVTLIYYNNQNNDTLR